jgi:hypothetical protein
MFSSIQDTAFYSPIAIGIIARKNCKCSFAALAIFTGAGFKLKVLYKYKKV